MKRFTPKAPPAALIIIVQMLIALCTAFRPEHAQLMAIFGWVLGVLVILDIMILRLPDMLTLPLIGLGLIVSPLFLSTSLWGDFIGCGLALAIFACLSLAYRQVRGHEGLGLGDAKLAGVCGAWLGWQVLPAVILSACAGGFVLVAFNVLRKGQEGLKEPIPFGVPLAASIWAWLLIGPTG